MLTSEGASPSVLKRRRSGVLRCLLKLASHRADKCVVCGIRKKVARVCEGEGGYTLAEVLTAVAIVSVILAIGIIVLLALLERWRVEAAADLFAADLRLAHTRATEQLTDWRVVFMPDGTPLSGCASADYCMVKLNFPYGAGDPTPALADDAPLVRRELPDRTKYQGSHLRS